MDLLRFRGLAKDAKAFEVLKEIEDRGTERAREKAKRILPMMRAGGDGEEDNRLDFDGVLESGGFARTRFRGGGGRNMNVANSTTF